MHEGAGLGRGRPRRRPLGLGVDDGRPRRRARRATRTPASTSSTSPPPSRSRRSRAAKAAGVEISAEASPHHLCLTDEEVRSLDPHRFKMNPPLRAESDRQALIDGLRDGTIECIATDHAPHQAEEKEVPFEQAAMGVTGLETAFAALHTELVLPGVIDLGLLVERLAGGAAPFGIERPTLAPGSEANVALCDLGAEWTVGEDGYESRSQNSWCAGRTLTGRVLMTVAAGQVAFRLRTFSPRSRRMSAAERLPAARGRDAVRRRRRLGARRARHRRGRLQHRDDRLPGVGHRPLLRGPDHRLHLPADRQLRRLRRGDGVRSGPRPRRRHARRQEPRGRRHRRGRLARLARRLRHAGDQRRRHPRPGPPHPRPRRDARRHLPGRDRRGRGARADRRRALDGRRRPRPHRHPARAGPLRRATARTWSGSTPGSSSTSSASCASTAAG